MIRLFLAVIIFTVFTEGNFFAQNQEALLYINEKDISPNSAQSQVLAKAKKEKALASYSIIRFNNLALLKEQTSFNISLPGKAPLSVLRKRFESKKANEWTLSGSLDNKGSIFLSATDDDITGVIHNEQELYWIKPIGNGLHILIKVDPQKLPRDEPEDWNPSPNKNTRDKLNPQSQIKFGQNSLAMVATSTPIINVLVVYTSAVEGNNSNMTSLINACIQSANESFTNSNMTSNVQLELAGAVKVNYTESGYVGTDKDRLITASDGYMDNIFSLRDQYYADVVVLLVDYDSYGYAGIAADIEVSSTYAYCVVVDDYAVGNYTFAHEIGHLIGARHDNDSNNSPRAYAHGYRYNPGNWRTIMAVYDPVVMRINYWSSPLNTYGGVAMGTADWNDARRVWSERAEAVSQFRQPLPPIISYFYQDPDPLYNGGTGYVYAQLSQGINVTYSWYASSTPSNITLNITPEGSRCQVHYYTPFSTVPTINLTCVASNSLGTDVKSYQLHCALYGYSSPASLAFETNGVLTDENPILVSSLDNPGVDVTDYYLINKEITPENQPDGKAGNVVKFSIHETDQAKGHTDLDQVELWEVKANKNEFVAVTEEGEVISYKKLVTPNHIILNDSLDVTNILADKDNLKLTVKKGDRIKIKHPGNAEELYSVFYAQLYNSEELSAANNNSSDLYYFRPQSSAVCKKLKVVTSGDIELAFSKDLVLDYFALIKNEKTAKAEKLNLLSAEHSKAGEAVSLFAAADKQYGEILPGEEIKFKYEAKPNSNNDNTAYILKAVGKYEKAGLLKEGNHETISGLPKETTLYDNYPNPFNPTAKISFSLPQKSEIKLKVFDVLGREIQILAEGIYEAGKYEVEFNASNLPSGVYFYNLTSGTNSITKKMLLMK